MLNSPTTTTITINNPLTSFQHQQPFITTTLTTRMTSLIRQTSPYKRSTNKTFLYNASNKPSFNNSKTNNNKNNNFNNSKNSSIYNNNKNNNNNCFRLRITLSSTSTRTNIINNNNSLTFIYQSTKTSNSNFNILSN